MASKTEDHSTSTSTYDESTKQVILKDFSLTALPVPKATIVESEKQDLHHIQLESLVDDLAQLGNCVRIAYLTRHTGLQIDIQHIAYDVNRLCHKSAHYCQPV